MSLGESLDGQPLVKQQIYLEPMESRVLFALHKVRQLEFPGWVTSMCRVATVRSADIDGDC